MESQLANINSTSKKTDSSNNDIDFEKVLDPNIRGHGNYALLELNERSAQKVGVKRVITPLKNITRDRSRLASEGKA